eukprot:TRINITY_DN7213_c0_g2_i1.p3 TRINITY_DN7213_c0_g2~~TRINITY_DN7213_c0_g2_i1.p3  ORF type:complete len:157 (-),score=15.55 TRINITY_DN7213_c0_g2_i1:825-1295(-)
MIELDKRLRKVCEVVNKCYEALFPNYPRYPQFTFTRAMITMWKEVVYAKLSGVLFEGFATLFKEVSNNRLTAFLARPAVFASPNEKALGGASKEKRQEAAKEQLLGRYFLLFIGRMVQAIVDLSVNDLKIHFLGSTKFVPDGPYSDLHEAILEFAM